MSRGLRAPRWRRPPAAAGARRGHRHRPDRHLGGPGAARRGWAVWLADADPAAAQLAADIGAGSCRGGAGELRPPAARRHGPADVAVLAVPPGGHRGDPGRGPGLGPGPLVHRRSQREGAADGTGRASWAATWPSFVPAGIRCPGGSGRARPRPGLTCSSAAPGDLPAVGDRAGAVAAVDRAGPGAAGRSRSGMAAAEHDRWVALVSHAPHAVAVAMAARLEKAPHGALAWRARGCATSPGSRPGKPGLWTQILAANAAMLARCWRRWRPTWPRRRPRWPGSPQGDEEAVKRPGRTAGARRSRGGQDPGEAGQAGTGLRDRPGGHPRPARRAGQAVPGGGRRPGSTSRTCGSSTRRACRSAWRSWRSGRRQRSGWSRRWRAGAVGR